jgi:hypothetical protein
MKLLDAMQVRGYSFRQHLEEAGWTARKLTVVDLEDEQRKALEAGGIEGLRRMLEKQGKWTFPALDIEEVLPIEVEAVLAQDGVVCVAVVVPAGDAELERLGRELVEQIEKRFGVRFPLCSDGEVELASLESRHLLVVGGAHQNRLAMELALRCQTGFVDAVVPGDGGWVVTSHVGLDGSGNDVIQIAASPEHRGKAVEYLLEGLSGDRDRLGLRRRHCIEQGEKMRRHLPDWERYASRLPGRIICLEGENIEAPADPADLADLLAVGLDSGGPDVNLYNVAPIDIAAQCARYYQLSGEPRALQLFRELLFRLADYYLKTPEGASYPADLDFRLGTVILYYARLEHESVFSVEDRLILSNLLLACTRSIYEYMVKMWPIDPDAPTRHNHETFPARSLMYAAEYFGRYGVQDVSAWRSLVDVTFSGELWSRRKQKENANGYELMAFEHGAAYSTFVGRGLEMFEGDCPQEVVGRQIAVTDNFFRPVDYGDASVSMGPASADLADILAGSTEEARVRWYAHESFARRPEYLGNPLHGIPGIRGIFEGRPPQGGGWELMRLEPRFREEYAPGFPQELVFDKLAFRTGWGEDDQYLLLEGVGNLDISHAHNEVNGIVRLNHLGRHWVVSNGYGRRTGMSNVNESFNTRIRGPEDHNMLVLQKEGEIVRDLPVCNMLLQQGQQGKLLYATGALMGYGGVNWFRTLIVLAGRFLLAVDRVEVVQAGLEKGHIEWNCLGDVEDCKEGFRLEQKGVWMDVVSNSGWKPEREVADQSASWQSVLDGSGYPHASFPLKKLLFHLPAVEVGQTHCLATLLAATRSNTPDFAISQPATGRVVVTGPHGQREDTEVVDRDLELRIAGESIELGFAAIPELPRALKNGIPVPSPITRKGKP